MYDMLIQNCNLFDRNGETETGMDVAVAGGTIAAVGRGLPGDSAVQTVDGTGKLLIPGFIDPHVHLDKALTIADEEADGLADAITLFDYHQRTLTDPAAIRADVRRRAAQVLDMEIAAGATCVRSHVLCDETWGMESVYALDELRREYADRLEVHLIVPWCEALAGPLDEACRAGMVDFFAGYAHLEPDYRADVDGIFSRVEKYGILPDLHSDESDAGDLGEFIYIQEKGLAAGLTGKVNCSHVTAMCAAPDEEAAQAIDLAAKLQTNIITLPSCNMYLMGRNDHQPVRRGVTRVREFLEAGVNVAYGSDNIRDPFRPFGRGDMLEEGLFTAQVIQYGTAKKLAQVLYMGTYAAARAAQLDHYGLEPGCHADLVLLDAATPREALVTQCARTLVMKGGTVTARNGVLC